MTGYTRTIFGLVTLRKRTACRACALLLVALILSPFTAPFATFELVAAAEITDGSGASTKVAADAAMDPECASFEPHLFRCAWFHPSDLADAPDFATAFHTVLRL
jgi:hypothetical protein